MNYSENLVPITDSDRAYLKKQAKLAILVISLIMLVFWGLATTFCIYDGDWYVFYFVGFFSLIFIFIGMFVFRRAAKYAGSDAKKWVIEGEILEKREKTTVHQRNDGQDMDTDYYLILEKREIKVNSSNYKNYNAGDIVKIEVTENGDVTLCIYPIKIKEREEETPVEDDYLSGYSEYMQDEERKIIRKSLVKRSIISLVVLAVVYFIALIVSAIVIAYNFDRVSQPARHLMVFGRYYIVILLGIALYTLMIRKLLADLLSNQKKVTTYTVNDKIHSNVKLLGKHIKTSIQGDYYYILAGKKLYNIPADNFHRMEIGNKIKIHVGNKSGYFLGVESSILTN